MLALETSSFPYRAQFYHYNLVFFIGSSSWSNSCQCSGFSCFYFLLIFLVFILFLFFIRIRPCSLACNSICFMIKCLLASLNSKFVDLNVCSVLNEFFFFINISIITAGEWGTFFFFFFWRKRRMRNWTLYQSIARKYARYN